MRTLWQRLEQFFAAQQWPVALRPGASEADIAAYVATGEPMGKAGAYAVQGVAAAHIAHVSGSYSGIMGLPLFETAKALRSLGVRF